VVKPNKGDTTALQECECQFQALTSSFLSTYPQTALPSRWLIAHSGGLDSQLLLHLACTFLPLEQIVVLHVNHQLQTESEAWADFSQQQAANYGVAFERFDVALKNSSEVAARDARYQAFESFIQAGDCLLFGHHADDQAETLLFRWLRGSGIKGLQGMPLRRPLGSGVLLRPLLYCSKQQLQQAVIQLDLPYVDDPSNAQLDYDRNFLRHKILPELKSRWPNLLQRWQKNADLAASSDRLLALYLEQDLQNCLGEQGQLKIARWQQLDELKRPEVLRHWLYQHQQLLLNANQLAQIEKDVILAQVDANPVYELTGCSLRRFQNALYLVPALNDYRESISIDRLGSYDLGDGELELVGPNAPAARLHLKRRKGGETCRPKGRNRSIAVKKLLQEAAISPWLRGRWPLIYQGETIVAVPGVCVCDGWDKESAGFSLLWRPLSLSD